MKRDLAGKNIFDAVNEIRGVIGDEVRFHVQTVGDTADEIIRDVGSDPQPCEGRSAACQG